MKKISTSLIALCLAASFVCQWGCNGGGPDPKIEQSRLDAASQYAGLYDKVGGNYDQLSAEDKASLSKLAGGDEKAQKAWQQMKDARTPRGQGGGSSRSKGGPGTPPAKPGA